MAAKFLRSPFLWFVLLGLACDTAGVRESRRWQYSCGDPVCHGYQAPPGVVACTDQRSGDACPVLDERCDPRDECNRLLVCTTDPPPPMPCPISRRDAKRDIRYLTTEELERDARDLRAIRLATYRYRDASASSAPRLGFVIDDGVPAACLEPGGDRVDLYGYASLAVATLQIQAREIEALRGEVAALRREVERAQRRAGR